MAEIEELLRGWDGLAVVDAYDCTTEAWIWIALHDDTLGQPVGGTRMRVYPSPAEGLREALRLAEGMTYKWSPHVHGVDFETGKAQDTSPYTAATGFEPPSSTCTAPIRSRTGPC